MILGVRASNTISLNGKHSESFSKIVLKVTVIIIALQMWCCALQFKYPVSFKASQHQRRRMYPLYREMIFVCGVQKWKWELAPKYMHDCSLITPASCAKHSPVLGVCQLTAQHNPELVTYAGTCTCSSFIFSAG